MSPQQRWQLISDIAGAVTTFALFYLIYHGLKAWLLS